MTQEALTKIIQDRKLGLVFDRLEKYCQSDMQDALREAFSIGYHVGSLDEKDQQIQELITKIRNFKNDES